MDKKILIWNCQGAASRKFRNVVKSLIDIHKPDMLVLLEPRISGIKAERLIHFLKFSHFHMVEALGFSGGIWCLWNDNWYVQVMFNHKQFVHLNVWDDSRYNFWFTVVYGSPQAKTRMRLWSDLTDIAATTTGPWIVAGNFNAVLGKNEKCGGARQAMGCKKFGTWIQDYSMIDMGFLGSRFTWRRGTVQERLDRFCV